MAVVTVLFSACTKDEVTDPVQNDITVTPPVEPVVGTGENGIRRWDNLDQFSGNVRYEGDPQVSQHVYGSGAIIKVD